MVEEWGTSVTKPRVSSAVLPSVKVRKRRLETLLGSPKLLMLHTVCAGPLGVTAV